MKKDRITWKDYFELLECPIGAAYRDGRQGKHKAGMGKGEEALFPITPQIRTKSYGKNYCEANPLRLECGIS